MKRGEGGGRDNKKKIEKTRMKYEERKLKRSRKRQKGGREDRKKERGGERIRVKRGADRLQMPNWNKRMTNGWKKGEGNGRR